MKNAFFKKGDILVYLMATILFVACVLLFLFPQKSAYKSIDIIDFANENTLLARYDVNTKEVLVYSQRVSVKEEDGLFLITILTDGKENVLQIANGKAKMVSAHCSQSADCTKFKEISGQGEEIVCLPHRLIIRGMGDNNHLVIG